MELAPGGSSLRSRSTWPSSSFWAPTGRRRRRPSASPTRARTRCGWACSAAPPRRSCPAPASTSPRAGPPRSPVSSFVDQACAAPPPVQSISSADRFFPCGGKSIYPRLTRRCRGKSIYPRLTRRRRGEGCAGKAGTRIALRPRPVRRNSPPGRLAAVVRLPAPRMLVWAYVGILARGARPYAYTFLP